MRNDPTREGRGEGKGDRAKKTRGEKGRGHIQMRTQMEQVTATEQSVMKQTG